MTTTDSKQAEVPLNGAYYGPAVPPTRQYHRPGRGGGCGCGCCLLGLLLKIVITIVVLLGLAALILWLVFRPNQVKFHVTDAKLTQFNFSSTNSSNLHYNLALDITIRNPNKHIGLYYDRIEARASYEDVRFASVFLTPFYQGHKNTTVLNVEMKGQNLVVLGASEMEEFNRDKSGGAYEIDVKLYLKMRLKLRSIKTKKFKPKIECDLRVPLGAASGSSFQTTKCDIDY